MMLIRSINRNLINAFGSRINRKIIVIESDDWGSIRMPSKGIYDKLLKEGYNPDSDPYLKYDSLANEEDLIALYEILSKFKDKNENPAIITANTIIANPNFYEIEKDDYKNYYYEPFTETLKKYSRHQNSFELWKEGIDNRLFHPQFHGREHLNVFNWLNELRSGNQMLRKAFDLGMISISSVSSKMRFGYMESLDYLSEYERDLKNKILYDGLNVFKNVFGTTSTSFIANCYIWDKNVEKFLSENNVKYIQGIPVQLKPDLSKGKHFHKRVLHYTGQKNKFGQTYLVRNAHFEPSLKHNIDTVGECLKRINIAFKWKKPAIISSHRLNFIGNIDSKNRDKNLILFKQLLDAILKNWPDVEFMTSDRLGKLMTTRMND